MLMDVRIERMDDFFSGVLDDEYPHHLTNDDFQDFKGLDMEEHSITHYEDDY